MSRVLFSCPECGALEGALHDGACSQWQLGANNPQASAVVRPKRIADTDIRTAILSNRVIKGSDRLAFAEEVVTRTVSLVALELGVSAKDIRDTSCKRPEIVAARWTAWRTLVALHPHHSVSSLARLWPCDHSGILYALNHVHPRPAGRQPKATAQ